MKKRHLFYGWYVALGCALVMFCTSGLTVNAFTVYQPYLIKAGGLTNSQSSAILTVRSLTSFAAMLLSGAFYKKISLRKGMLASVFMVSAGFALFGLSKRFGAYLIAGAVTGIGYGFGTMIPVSIVIEHWFVSEMTVALGFCSAATGLATLGIPSLITRIIEGSSLKVSFISEAVFIVLLGIISFLLIRDDPSEKGLFALGTDKDDPVAGVSHPGGPGIGRKEWMFIIPMLLCVGGMTNAGYSHLTVLAAGGDVSPELIALAITVSGLALMGGKFLYGVLSDKFSARKTNLMMGPLAAAGIMILCIMNGNPFLLLTAMVLYGAGLGNTTVGLSAWARDWAVPEKYDSAVELFQACYAAGTMLFSIVPGILADMHEGSYIPAYILFLVLTVFVITAVEAVYLIQKRK